MKDCVDCGYRLFNANSTKAFCNNCCKMREKDICEFLDEDGSSYYINDIPNEYHTSLDSFVQCISKMSTRVRLDLHGVLDTIPGEQFLNRNPEVYLETCCISYVGACSDTRIQARKDIQNRIGKQIRFGILVFKRSRNPSDRNRFFDQGSKAWINSIIPIPKGIKSVFIDDSYDHQKSVYNMNITNLDSRLFGNGDNLLSILANYY